MVVHLWFIWCRQLVDLFLIPNMVDDYNTKLKAKLGISTNGVPLAACVQWFVAVNIATTDVLPSRELMVLLLKAAAASELCYQAVMDTGASFAEEAILKEMLKVDMSESIITPTL